MDDRYGILEDAPTKSKPTCLFGLFDKRQLLYLALFWFAGVIVVGIVLGLPFMMYKILPNAVPATQAGLLSFSEERYASFPL